MTNMKIYLTHQLITTLDGPDALGDVPTRGSYPNNMRLDNMGVKLVGF